MTRPNLPAIERVHRYRSVVPDWDGFLDAIGRPLPLCLWTNTLRTEPAEVVEQLRIEGIDVRPVRWIPGAFKGPPAETAGQSLPFVAGLYHMQEEVSLLPVRLLDPQPGERVLDLCAAPGNKTAQAAVAMSNTGTVVANDRSALRMRATRGTLDRLGVMNTTITVGDAERFPSGEMSFDRVLVDAPCTCEGTSRKNVSAFVATGPEKSEALHDRQLAMLRRAVEVCRSGGRIVYSTCTYAPEENEQVVHDILQDFGSAVRLCRENVPELVSSSGLTEWNGRSFDRSLERTMRIWPHQNDTGGFFVAVLEKMGGDYVAGSRSGASETVSSAGAYLEWMELVEERFGVGRKAFSGWRFHQPNRKYLFVTPRDHERISVPEPVSDGLPFIRTSLRYPKLTTAAARIIGPKASKNVVPATVEQTEAFVSREEFVLNNAQAANLTGTGYVLVTHRGMVLGVGIYFENGFRVTSMFPKVLARAVNLPIPAES